MSQLLDRFDLNSLNEILFHIQSTSYTRAEINALLGAVSANDVRLEYVTATSLQLAGMYGTTGKITINGTNLDCSASFPTVAPTDNLITATGADSGGACGASTSYTIYASNSLATTFPSDVRLSATAHTGGYLGAAGNALNWKLVGWCKTTAASQFAFSATQKLVCSKFNPRFLTAYVTESTSHTYANTWRIWNNASATQLDFIVHEDHLGVIFTIGAFLTTTATGGGLVGLGIDSTTVPTGVFYGGGNAGHVDAIYIGGAKAITLATGYHYSHVLEYSVASNTTYDDAELTIGLFL
jgi:hypothetical protein